MAWTFFWLLCCAVVSSSVFGQLSQSEHEQQVFNEQYLKGLQQREQPRISTNQQQPQPQQQDQTPRIQWGSRPAVPAAVPDQAFNGTNAAAPNLANAVHAPQARSPLERFSTNLFQAIAPSNTHTNVIYSPISLQTLLAFLYIGADAYTAQELQFALQVPANKTQVMLLFQQLHSLPQSESSKLIMANKLYYSARLAVSPELQNYAQRYFDSEVGPVDFSSTASAAQEINGWVAAKTQNHIRNVISPSTLDARTAAILVNAIYFKAKWAYEFSTLDTSKQNFFVSKQRAVPVDMMYTEEIFRYAEFPELQASVLELPYKQSGLSMLIILPHEIDGLQNVELRLSNVELSDLAARLQPRLVTVRLPKFKINFELDMVEPLKMLGIRQLFSNNAQLTGFFQSTQPVGISKVQHKAYIEVNEAGSEAAAASFAKFIPLSLPPELILFTANHPFIFAIRSDQAVHFVGHVVNL